MRTFIEARREWEAANHPLSRERWRQYREARRIRGLLVVDGVAMVPAGPLVILPSRNLHKSGKRGPDKQPRKKRSPKG